VQRDNGGDLVGDRLRRTRAWVITAFRRRRATKSETLASLPSAVSATIKRKPTTLVERTFELLADFPKMGVAADELLIGARRFRFQSHIIFYTEDGDNILIRALFHAAQNLRPDLFD
jgi:plasmid stabilization system protein ParE